MVTYVWLGALCLCIQLVISCNFTALHQWSIERIGELAANNLDDPCSFLAGNRKRSRVGSSNVNAKVFLFQNDEHELLEDWLQYHAYLFGPNNLVIIDHMSRDDRICGLLALYRHCGTKVLPYAGGFDQKRTILSTVMRSYSKSLLIPLDTDEFVVLQERDAAGDTTGLIYERDKILHTIATLPIDGRKYKFDESYTIRYDGNMCNETVHNGDDSTLPFRRAAKDGYTRFAHNRTAPAIHAKTFYHSEGFIFTDQGNHFGKVVHDRGRINMAPAVVANMSHYFVYTDLALVHLVTPSYHGAKRKTLRGADAYGFTDSSNCTVAAAGRGYCEPAKLYRQNRPEIQQYYMDLCQREEADTYSMSAFNEWFRSQARSMQELVGDAYPRLHNHHAHR